VFTSPVLSACALSLTAALVGCGAGSSDDTPAPAPWASGPELSCRYTITESSIGSVGGYSTSWSEKRSTCGADACSAVQTPSDNSGFGVYTSYSVSEQVDLIGSCASGVPAACGDRKGATACETAVFASCCRTLLILEQDPNETRILDCLATCAEADAACPKTCTDGAPAASIENLKNHVTCAQSQMECATR